MFTVSVVIVSFNTREKLRRCLEAVKGAHEVIVVDNASSDDSPEMAEREFPEVILLKNAENRGFGAANNQGAERATGDLILYLNSDCYAEPGAVERLASVFSEPTVAAGGGRLMHPDGELQLSSANRLTLWAVFCEQTLLEKLLPRSRLFSPYWNSWRHVSTAPVEQVMGACLMVRRGAPRFDERFFLYCEDTELCHRLREEGQILYVPEAAFVHELGSSSSGARWRTVALYNRGKELYFTIHGRPGSAAACLLLNRLGALLRLLVWAPACLLTLAVQARFRSQVGLFWKVLTAPLSGPRLPARKRQ